MKKYTFESVEQFKARGGQVVVGPYKEAKGSTTFKKLSSAEIKHREPKEEVVIDYSLIPEHLKISLGIKD